MTLTPLLIRSAKYKVSVEGSNDHISVLAWVAPLVVQFGIMICVRKSNPANGVGVAASALGATPIPNDSARIIDSCPHKASGVFVLNRFFAELLIEFSFVSGGSAGACPIRTFSNLN